MILRLDPADNHLVQVSLLQVVIVPTYFLLLETNTQKAMQVAEYLVHYAAMKHETKKALGHKLWTRGLERHGLI